jgi:hypothetical protein
VAFAALAASALAGCSLRLEKPPVAAPARGQYELLRDAAARSEVRVLDALGAVAPGQSTPGHDYFVKVETASATPHLKALGGVYVPFPSAAPASPSPGRAPAPASLTSAVVDARDADLAAALIANDPDLALLLASIGLCHAEAFAVGLYHDPIASGFAPLADERHMPGAAFANLVPASTSLDAETLKGLIVAHDYAAYAYEVIAARSTDDGKAQALARSRIHAQRAEALVAIARVDPRSPAYVIDHAKIGTDEAMASLARATELGIADRYVTAFFGAAKAGEPGRGDRGWLLAGAYDALAQGLLWPGAAAADALPLPGVVLPTG